MIVIPYQPAHLRSLLLQPAQAAMVSYFDNPAYAKALNVPGKSFTAMDGERVLAIAGVIPIWKGRGEAWALLGGDIRRHFLAIHHAVARFLDVCELTRIEAAVDADFPQGRAWVERLGFTYEGPLAKYTPDGRDCLRYARIK